MLDALVLNNCLFGISQLFWLFDFCLRKETRFHNFFVGKNLNNCKLM